MGRADIRWWEKNIVDAFSPIYFHRISQTIYTDASTIGWGVKYKNKASGGTWLEEENKSHINVLELQAIFLGIQCFIKEKYIHVKVYSNLVPRASCLSEFL